MYRALRHRLRVANGVDPPAFLSVAVRTEVGGDAGLPRFQRLPPPQTDLLFRSRETGVHTLLLLLFYAGQRSHLQKRIFLKSTRYCFKITAFLFLYVNQFSHFGTFSQGRIKLFPQSIFFLNRKYMIK
jgi:hypothetical protein